MSEPRIFWLHEDEWGMIDILPAENFASALQTAHEAEEFGKAHFDGFGWTDMYVIPEAKIPLAQRNIALSEIRALAQEHLSEADQVESGIRPGEISGKDGTFAFVAEDKSALYGDSRDNMVQYLCMLPPERVSEASETYWTSALLSLGTRHHLILADWWISAWLISVTMMPLSATCAAPATCFADCERPSKITDFARRYAS